MGSRGQEPTLDFEQQGVLLSAEAVNFVSASSSVSSSSAAVALSSSTVPSALDWSRVPTVSLHAALALHTTGVTTGGDDDSHARALSRKRTLWDATELPTVDDAITRGEGPSARRLPILAPTGTLPPLAAPEQALFAAVRRTDVAAVRRLVGAPGPASPRRALSDQEEEEEPATRSDGPARPEKDARAANVLAVHPESGANVMHLAATAWEDASADANRGRALTLACLADECGAGRALDARAFNGSTPLHWAAGLGHLDAVCVCHTEGRPPCVV